MADKDLNTSAILKEIGKKEGYTIPDNYFDTLPEKIYAQLDINTIPQENVPEGYFDNLSGRVMDKVKTEESGQARIVVMNTFKKYSSIAAVFIVLIGAGLWVFNNDNTTTTDEWSYLEYLNENPSEVDLSTLVDYELINEEDLLEMDISLIDDAEIDRYLENNLDEIEINYLDELYE